MARPQQFSEDQALNRAMEAFWEKGFHATSMQDLVDYTGVCRASLYKTFGNKDELFEQALGRYQREQQGSMQAALHSDLPIQELLRRLFRAKAQEVVAGKRSSCLMVSATSELASQDEKIRSLLQENERHVRQWFQRLLEQGQARQELAADLDTATLGHYLFTAYQGLGINAMTQDDAGALDQVIETILMPLHG